MDIVYSNNYLVHHGILGQKWGVRRYQNYDGSLTDKGRKRLYKTIKKDFKRENRNRKHGVFYDSSIYDESRINYTKTAKRGSIYEKIHNELSKDREEYKKALEPYKEFNSNKELVKEYQKKAARKFWEESGKDHGWTLENAEYWYTEDDGDQGENSSFQLYCKDKGLNADKVYKDAYNAEHKYLDQCKKVVDTYLQEYSNKPLKNEYGQDSTVSKVVSETMLELADDEISLDGYYIYL